MPSLSTYKNIMNITGRTSGQAKKLNSDMILEATWDDDISSRVGYLYDYYHDDEFDVEYDLHPNISKTKIPIDIKFIEVSYNTMDKDQVAYHIQFRPSQKCNVPYYDKVFAKKYHTRFPLGLYIDIPDNNNNYQRWLVVEKGDVHQNQFDTWFVLPCDYKFQWVYQGKKYEMWGVCRSQNS
jgi:hypothetical protein